MTDVIVTDSNKSVVVSSVESSNVIISPKQPTTIVTGVMGPAGRTGSIADISDTDLTNLQEGSLLVYNTATLKWVSTTLLNRQQVDCGEF